MNAGTAVNIVPLKPVGEVTAIDAWWDGFYLKRSVESHHAMIDEVRLSPGVPPPVRQHFETARNVYLYSLFAHRMLMVAELQAWVATEAALFARRYPEAKPNQQSPGLKKLLKHAIAQTWLRDEGFAIHRRHEAMRRDHGEMMQLMDKKYGYRPPADHQAYCKVLTEAFPDLRNGLAHGETMLHNGVLGTFEIVADLINQLFAASAGN